ncbi:MAG: hypothetical protein IPH07_19955 [Deltaproteobacteria bacterium]|nr:hypothetical protein [Deltaproteobacteria bacterium]MBK8715980.1 hypothetical protein [Deltaproteobacteria bacterium]MBP7289894.1 hypothetical protein [Nannocystaceae bacterium]
MTLSRIRLAISCLLLGGAACFVEPPDVTGPGTTTSTQECVAGGVGCACYGNGTCDAGLECAAGPAVCVPAGCEPGQASCTCDHDACLMPLVCIAGVCATPQGGSSSDGSSGDSGVADDGTSSQSVTSEGETAADSSSGDVSAGSTTDVGPSCDELMCNECPSCVTEEDGDCADDAAACEALEGCPAAAACLANCGISGLCIDPCCGGLSASAIAAASAVNVCRRDACSVPCPDYNPGSCQ